MFAHVIVSGFVQGVGYRQFVKKTARNLGLKGWSKNISEGRVEVVFVGEKQKIEEALKILKKGPFLSEVRNMDVEWEEKDTDFNSFEIIV